MNLKEQITHYRNLIRYIHLLPTNEQLIQLNNIIQKFIEKYPQFTETKLTPKHSLIKKYKYLKDNILKSIHTKTTDSLWSFNWDITNTNHVMRIF